MIQLFIRKEVISMNEQLKVNIINYAKEIGIDKIGFTSSDPFPKLKTILEEHRSLGYESGFEEKDIEKRVNPSLTMDDAKSIIAIAIGYPAKLTDPPKSSEGNYRGFISRSAWGIDYHHILQEKLHLLGQYIEKLVPNAKYVYMTDTGVLSDHAVAERAGIGWIGKNSLLITPEFGSYVYLGEMITNLELEPDSPMEDQCGDCTKCIDACPTQAIVQPGQVNAMRCLSFVTQRKDMLEEYYMEKLGNRLYGCDTCQLVCPKNRGINSTHQENTLPNPELAKPLLKPLLTITNKEFKESWGLTAAAWRGKKPIQRNAIIALAHFKDKTAIPDLEKLYKTDERPVIRQTAVWALGKIGSKEALNVLQMAKMNENDTKVLHEIEKSLNKLANEEKLD